MIYRSTGGGASPPFGDWRYNARLAGLIQSPRTGHAQLLWFDISLRPVFQHWPARQGSGCNLKNKNWFVRGLLAFLVVGLFSHRSPLTYHHSMRLASAWSLGRGMSLVSMSARFVSPLSHAMRTIPAAIASRVR